MPKFVIIESPYAGDVEKNVAYARKALKHSIDKGEVAFAGHLLYPQVLNDRNKEERYKGMRIAAMVNLGILKLAAEFSDGQFTVAVYDDLGISPGMKDGIIWAAQQGALIEFRSIGCD